jgi:hypothetical protein
MIYAACHLERAMTPPFTFRDTHSSGALDRPRNKCAASRAPVADRLPFSRIDSAAKCAHCRTQVGAGWLSFDRADGAAAACHLLS